MTGRIRCLQIMKLFAKFLLLISISQIAKPTGHRLLPVAERTMTRCRFLMFCLGRELKKVSLIQDLVAPVSMRAAQGVPCILMGKVLITSELTTICSIVSPIG